MGDKLNSLIKKIILGTTAIGTTFAGGIQLQPNTSVDKQNLDDTIKESDVRKAKHPAFILQKPSVKNFLQFVSHRSHRSHSSHRSHYSHVSSYTQPKETDKETNDVIPEEKNVKTSPSKDDNQMIYEFGSRILKKGMSGTDVVELQTILKKKGYELETDGSFGEATESAVKDFQKENSIDQSGIVEVVTIYYLKK